MTIRTKIVKIGNSQGLRLSKTLLSEAGISGDVDVIARNGEIIVQAAHAVRDGWEDAFQEMAARQDDVLLNSDTVTSEWDESEWTWE